VTPIAKAGQSDGKSYVFCLDCYGQFEYDVNEKRVGKAIDHSHDGSIVPPNLPTSRNTKLGYALLTAVPAAVMLGVVLKGKKKAEKPGESKHEPERDESFPRDE
jgi:hypothetical protein